ncbi:MAG: ABC transporter permease [Ignavibacteriales bacterium]|nr:MAG: ABC transporter permease [Ignavibacteriales bacterium]
MLKNYIKIALRNISRYKVYSFINILGLSLGIGITILIYLYVKNDFSYDDFHERGDRIYRIVYHQYERDGSSTGLQVHAPIPFGPDLKNEMPEVEHSIRFSNPVTFIRNNNVVDEEEVLMADRTFFKTFSFEFKHGKPETSLNDPYSIVLTEEMTEKYFGKTNPVGKTLEVLLGDEYTNLNITGVLKKIPANSSLKFKFIIPYDLLRKYEWFRDRETSYNSWNSPTWVLLKENTDVKLLEAKMVDFWEKYLGEQFAEQRSRGEWKFDYHPVKAEFQPLKDVHHAELKYSGIAESSDFLYSYILTGIAVAILLIACINFMNLSISRISTRSSEVAVRKVIGASRKNLIIQFWGEALLLSLFSMFFAMLFVEVTLPFFNSIIKNELSLNIFSDWQTLLGILAITVTAGLIAGSYPALVMSALKPVQVLSRKLKFGSSNLLTRSLLVLQFSLAVFFIAATIIMAQQMNFLKNKNLGFDKEQVIVIRGNYQKVDATRILEILKKEFRDDADVNMLSGISYSFTRGSDQVAYEDSKGEKKIAYVYRIDENFIDLMKLELAEGRSFNLSFQTDSTDAVIVNEELVKHFAIKDPVGSRLDGFGNRNLKDPYIIGVVKDFNFNSLEEKIEPAIMYMSSGSRVNYILAKLNPHRIEPGISKLKSKWSELEPDIPFQFSFLDKDIESQYEDTMLKQQVINYSAGFIILIAVIGLFGLSSFTTERRKKEIGIRKILGASFPSLLKLLTKEFIILIAVASVTAFPVVYYIMKNWLDNFAYRIEISFWIFLTSGLIALIISVLTISSQVIRTANLNPVKMINYE